MAKNSASQKVDGQHHEGNRKENGFPRNADGDPVCRTCAEELAGLLLVWVQVQELLCHVDLSPGLSHNLQNPEEQPTG